MILAGPTKHFFKWTCEIYVGFDAKIIFQERKLKYNSHSLVLVSAVSKNSCNTVKIISPVNSSYSVSFFSARKNDTLRLKRRRLVCPWSFFRSVAPRTRTRVFDLADNRFTRFMSISFARYLTRGPVCRTPAGGGGKFSEILNASASRLRTREIEINVPR